MIIGISGKKGSGKDLAGEIIQYLSSQETSTFYAWQNAQKVYDKSITKNYRGGWEIKKFADKLKDITCMLLGCTREQLEDREYKEAKLGDEWKVWRVTLGTSSIKAGYNRISLFNTEEEARKYKSAMHNLFGAHIHSYHLTPRLILQLLGTEAGRQILHPNIWVNAVMSEYKGKYVGGADPYQDDPDVEYPPIEVFETDFPNWVITDVRFPNEAQAIKDKGGILIRLNRGLGDTGNHASETALDNYDGFDVVIANNGTIDDLIKKLVKVLDRHAKNEL